MRPSRTARRLAPPAAIAFELDDIVAPTPGISLYGVYDIGEAGQIAATGGAGGGFRALRLDPVAGGLGLTGPDPALPLFLLIGAEVLPARSPRRYARPSGAPTRTPRTPVLTKGR